MLMQRILLLQYNIWWLF